MAGTNLGTAYVTIMPSAKGMGNALSQQMNSEGGVAGKSFGGGLAKAAIGAMAAAGIGVAVKNFFSSALEAGGALQQSFGGLDTIYGDAADSMKELAYEAAKAGISANDYAEQAVSFGASLKQAFGGDTVAAAKSADMAIMDMADNAAKMGTDVSMLQNAYQGFAKQNYTMLDNLKLGYGGTKTEMERLLEDANKINAAHGIMSDYSIDNLGHVYEAIHVVQEELNLTGVAAAEGAETFTGSMGAMKASAQNLLANLALGEDIKEPLTSLVENTKAFLTNNLFPMIGNVLEQLPGLLGEGLNWAFENIPNIVDSAIAFINKLTTGMTENSGAFKEKLVEIGHAALEMFKNIDWKGLGTAVISFIWTGLQLIGGLLWSGLKALGELAVTKMKEIDWIQLGKDVIKFIWEGLGRIGSWIWEKLKALGDAAVEKFKSIDWKQLGKDTINFIVDGLKEIGKKIWEKLKALGETAVEKFKEIDWLQLGKDVINALWEGIKSVGGWVVDGISWLAEKGAGLFSGDDAESSVDWYDTGYDVPEDIASGIENNGWRTSNAMTGIMNDAWNAASGNNWFSLGDGIISGIVSGIAWNGYRVYNELYANVSSAWERAKSSLGINSPSKVMRDEIGLPIAEGIAVGIEKGRGLVTSAMDDVTKDLTTSIDTGYAYNATITGAQVESAPDNSPITINVYPSAGMDEKALADMVEQRLAFAQRQRQTAWGMA